jgi:beta-1,4-mannosyl-glycoprotein beta-1,4-N-acetylglucosaminyltransferase
MGIRIPRPRRNAIVIFTVLAALFFFLTRDGNSHVVDPEALANYDGAAAARAPTSEEEVAALCRKHKFSPWRQTGQRKRKVYDLFLMSTELDWLEIRLNTLAPYVDYFVIVESPTTFTGMRKPLYLEDNWKNFTKFHDKIFHTVVKDPGPSLGYSTWTHEDFMRDSLYFSAFAALTGPKEPEKGDVIIVSDIDEIPKPETINALRHCDIPDRVTLRSHFYYYSYQWLHIGQQWPHPQATVFNTLSTTLKPSHLRKGNGGLKTSIPFLGAWRRWSQKADMWDAAWHCSSCFSTLKEMVTKMQSFSHTPLNTAENRDRENIKDRVRSGKDLYGRRSETYQRIENNHDLPQYILENRQKFWYMLDRDGKTAGFKDWNVSEEEDKAAEKAVEDAKKAKQAKLLKAVEEAAAKQAAKAAA